MVSSKILNTFTKNQERIFLASKGGEKKKVVHKSFVYININKGMQEKRKKLYISHLYI